MNRLTEADRPDNPFLIYRDRLDSYDAVRSGRMSDDRFIEIVTGLDDAIEHVEGHGFVVTPLVDGSALAAAAGLDIELWIKAEPGNVGASHKARHLFGVALQMLVDEELGAVRAERLAIASCGNAAVGAAVVAAAMKRPLDVFVPTWADERVVEILDRLDANVNRCARVEGEAGDPAYLRFRDAVNAGARAFSVQGTDTPAAFDGGRTLGWELADQVPGGPSTDDSLYIQVGGGALAVAVSAAVPEPKLFPVQTEGCAPLRRAWDLLSPDFDFDAAAKSPEDYMWAWETEPHSLATGILDDVTYDWLPLLRQTRQSGGGIESSGTDGGEPIVVAETFVEQAHALALSQTDIAVSPTGSSGLAGLLQRGQSAGRALVLFTGAY
ncbi:MAG: pyridoxal-phosphate dependent enzyme [Acidimicrobiales bacterium]